jgi:ADP-ribose pyrophosphatase
MDDLAWTTHDSTIDYECPGFRVREDGVTLPDGTDTSFHAVEDADTVVVLPVTPDDEVVVIEEWRQAVGHVADGLPAGGMEDGEDIDAAARRELTEETGYEADTVAHVGSFEPANGLLAVTNHYVVARGCRPTGEQNLDANESIRVGTTTLAALEEAIASDECRDGRTALAVLYARATGALDGQDARERNA